MDYSVYQSDVLQGLLNSYWNNQTDTPSSDEEATEPVNNQQEEDAENTDDNGDLQGKYDDLVSQNETLQRQLDEYDFHNNNDNDLTFLNSLFEDNAGHQPNNFESEANVYRKGDSQMVTNSDIAWLKTKDKSVNLSNLDKTIGGYLNTLPPEYKQSLVATSGNDADVHVPNSKHYNNEAVDLRYNDNIYNYMTNDPNLKALGLKVLPPNHGTAPHIHIEKKQYGGKMQDGGKNKPKPNYGDTIAGIRSNQLQQAALPHSQTPTDYDSKDFFNRVKQDDPQYYQALIQTAKHFGKDIPSISYTNQRSHYNPINNNISVDTTGTGTELYTPDFKGSVDTYIDELSHKNQFDNKNAAKQWLQNDLPDYVTNVANSLLIDGKYAVDGKVNERNKSRHYSVYPYYPYKDKQALEGEAHSVITPQIRDYFYNAVDSLKGTGKYKKMKYGGTIKMQDGGGLFKKNKIAYVDSTLNANKNLDWVKRLYEKNTPTLQLPNQPYPSTHFMADDGNGYVFPTIVRENGKLKYLADSAEDYARKTNTGIQFPKNEGTWFANNGYKLGTGVLNRF